MSEILIHVRYNCGAHRARVDTGTWKLKVQANARASDHAAAHAVAVKCFGADRVHEVVSKDGDNDSGSLFVARAKPKVESLSRTVEQTDLAFAACRSIVFAVEDCRRHSSWDYNSLLAAERLALVALGKKTKAEVGL